MGMIVLAGTLVVGNVLFTMFTHQHIWSGADMYTRMSGSGFYNGSISAERGSIYDSKGEAGKIWTGMEWKFYLCLRPESWISLCMEG